LAEALPCNVALHCEVAPGAIDAGAQDTETDDTVLAAEVAMYCEPPQAAQHSRTVLAAKTHATLRPRTSSLAFIQGSNRSLYAPVQTAHSAPREQCALLFCLVFHESLDAGRRRGFVSKKPDTESQP